LEVEEFSGAYWLAGSMPVDRWLKIWEKQYLE
jgi:hypothetical protein